MLQIHFSVQKFLYFSCHLGLLIFSTLIFSFCFRCCVLVPKVPCVGVSHIGPIETPHLTLCTCAIIGVSLVANGQ